MNEDGKEVVIEKEEKEEEEEEDGIYKSVQCSSILSNICSIFANSGSGILKEFRLICDYRVFNVALMDWIIVRLRKLFDSCSLSHLVILVCFTSGSSPFLSDDDIIRRGLFNCRVSIPLIEACLNTDYLPPLEFFFFFFFFGKGLVLKEKVM